MRALGWQGRPAESFRDRMGPVVLLFAPRDTTGESHEFGEGWVSSGEIMAMLGKLGGQLVCRWGGGQR